MRKIIFVYISTDFSFFLNDLKFDLSLLQYSSTLVFWAVPTNPEVCPGLPQIPKIQSIFKVCVSPGYAFQTHTSACLDCATVSCSLKKLLEAIPITLSLMWITLMVTHLRPIFLLNNELTCSYMRKTLIFNKLAVKIVYCFVECSFCK